MRAQSNKKPIALMTLLFVAFPLAAETQEVGLDPEAESGAGAETWVYDGYLDDAEVEGLLEALDAHYRAFAMYTAVIDELGPVSPFALVLRGEERAIDALVYLLDRFAVPVPENTWLGAFDSFGSLEQACGMAAAEERATGEMYDALMRETRRNTLLLVYDRLQSASERYRLPMFERCAGREGRLPQS
jgi:hypothetical protein